MIDDVSSHTLLQRQGLQYFTCSGRNYYNPEGKGHGTGIAANALAIAPDAEFIFRQ